MTFFDLRALESDKPYQIGKYYFQFCRRLTADDTKTFAYLETGSMWTSQTLLTGGSRPVNVKAVTNEVDPDLPRHITYEMAGGEQCKTNSARKYSVRYEIKCNPEKKGKPVLDMTNLNIVSDPCSPKLTFEHEVGCPAFEATSIVRFLSENPWAMGILLLLFGSLVTFFGGKFFTWVLACVAGAIVFLAIMVFASILGAFKALDQGREATPGWITLAVMTFLAAVGLAIFVAWFIKRIQRHGICAMGTVAGFLIGFVLYTFVFAQWFQHVGLLIGLTGLGGLILGWLAWKYDRHIIVYLTAFFGSYALIRGISLFAGGYPNEVLLYQQIQNDAFDVEWPFYLYVFFMVATGVCGVYFQLKRGYQKHEEEEDFDSYYKKV